MSAPSGAKIIPSSLLYFFWELLFCFLSLYDEGVPFLLGVVGLLAFDGVNGRETIISESSPEYEVLYSLSVAPPLLLLLLLLLLPLLLLLLEDLEFSSSLLRLLPLLSKFLDDALFDLNELFLAIEPLLPDLVRDDDDFICFGALGFGELTERALGRLSLEYFSLKNVGLLGLRGLSTLIFRGLEASTAVLAVGLPTP